VSIPGNDEIKHWSANFIKYLSELEFWEKEKKMTLSFLLKSLQQTREEVARIVKELRKVVQEDEEKKKIIERLLSVPGIGFITAVTLYTEIIDIKRFGKFDQLVAYVGFAPDTNSSGENEKVVGITQRKQAYLRNLLIEAAWMAVRKDPAMTAAFAKLTQRMIKQRAIVRIAKKLVSRIMYVWTNEKDYVFAVVA
jgi:transposase